MKKGVSTRFVLIGVGILLVLLGVQALAVKIAGTSTQGTVTGVKQIVNQSSERMDYNYQIRYRFTVNGKNYVGSMNRKKVYNAATLPAEGSAVGVRYLAFAPFLNGPANASPLTGIALGALGAVLAVAGLRVKHRPASEPAGAQNQPSA